MRKSGYLLDVRPTDRRRFTAACPMCGESWTGYFSDEKAPSLPKGWVWMKQDCGCKIAKHVACPMAN